MKIRISFVSNSSSSSFIFAFPKEFSSQISNETTITKINVDDFCKRFERTTRSVQGTLITEIKMPKKIKEWLLNNVIDSNNLYEVSLWYTKWTLFKNWCEENNIPYQQISGPQRWGSIWNESDFE